MQQSSRSSAPALVYAAGILAWYPLCIHRYYDGSSVKFSAYFVFSLAVLAAGAVLAVCAARGAKPAAPGLRGVLGALVAASAVVSTLASPAPISAFWGLDGYLGGACLLLLGMGGYRLLRRGLPAQNAPFLAWLLVGCGVAVTALALLNDLGLDPFGIYRETDPAQYLQFFSTIGNIDYLNAFVCLWLPLACLQTLTAAKRGVPAWFFAALVGFCGMAFLDTGLATLGMAGALLVLLAAVPLQAAQYPRLLALAGAWLLAQGAAGAVAARLPLQRAERIFAALPAAPTVAAALLVFAVAALLHRLLHGSTRVLLALQRGVAAAACAALVCGFALANFAGVSLGALDNFFVPGAAWGTGRGAIYADMLAIFAAAPPLRKLVGYGCGLIAALMDWTPDLPYPMWDVFGAHSEYLELLLAAGVLGLALWLAVLAVHIIPALQRKNAGCGAAGWALCLVAYSVQAAFSNRVAAVFPVFMVVLGVVAALLPRAGAPRAVLPAKRCAALAFAAAPLLACSAWGGTLLFARLFGAW